MTKAPCTLMKLRNPESPRSISCIIRPYSTFDMPAQPLPGDLFTPRMHWNTNGASERMVVSPGNEREGIMHMPTGQSGHPLSQFYGNSHDAWARGEPTPFMPGPTRFTLTLAP